MRHHPWRMNRQCDGTALIEFAIVLPVLLLLVLGGLEIGHTMYVNSILVGQVQKAGRDLTLEGSGSAAAQTAIENNVTNMIHQVIGTAQVSYQILSFHDYANAANRAEEFGDTNHDGKCDNGETFVDSNANGSWDADGSVSGRGGSKDVVLLTATVTYPRLLLGRTFAASPTVTMQASTLLRNQPSATQSQPPTGTCP